MTAIQSTSDCYNRNWLGAISVSFGFGISWDWPYSWSGRPLAARFSLPGTVGRSGLINVSIDLGANPRCSSCGNFQL